MERIAISSRKHIIMSPRSHHGFLATILTLGFASTACSVNPEFGDPEVASASQDVTGPCPIDCLGGALVGGQCQPIQIIGALSRPAFLAVTATDVFVTGTVNYTISRSSVLGGPVETVASGGSVAFGPQGIAVTGGHVLWAANRDGKIWRAGLHANDATSVLLAAGQGAPIGVATDGVYVYWASHDGGTIARTRIRQHTDDPVEVLASGQNQPWGVAVRGGSVFWTNWGGGGSVMRLDLPALCGSPLPSPSTLVAAAGGTPAALAVDATSVYWVDGSAVKKVPIGGGAPVILASGQNDPKGVVVDAAHIYWSSYGAGTITRANLNGSAATVIASGQRQPFSMAIDDLAVYWVNDEFRLDCASPPCGGVMKLAK
jgi:hypothetical protein